MKINLRKKHFLSQKAGFTLMEIVVALSIFSIASTAAISIFVQSNTVQKRTANIDRLVSDARYALEVMAREVRMGVIDYDYSGYTLPISGAQTELAVLDADNEPLRFRREVMETGRAVLQVCYGQTVCAPADWLDITPEDLTVTKLAFYISPGINPFVWDDGLVDYASDKQPLVTIVLETESTYRDSETVKTSNFQTTVSSRKYVR